MAKIKDRATTTDEEKQIIGGVHTRFNRQEDFVPTGSLAGKEIWVIGCGAIGRQVALQLAAIGVREIGIIDFDTVTPTNVTTQGFLATDVGKEKVHALEDMIKAIDPEIKVNAITDKYRPEQNIKGIVFLCVDDIEVRARIWKYLKKDCELVVDGRMQGEVWRVLAANDEETRKHFESTFFAKKEAVPGRCTGHATIYSASMPASWMVHQLTKHIRKFPLDQDMLCNMLAGEFAPVLT